MGSGRRFGWLWREVELEGGWMQGIELEGFSRGEPHWLRAATRSIEEEGSVSTQLDTE